MRFLIYSVLFLTLSILGGDVRTQELAPETSEKIHTTTLGCLFPITGEYELVGKKALKGALLATDMFSPKTDFQVVLKDISSSPNELEKAVEELTARDGVSIIIGPPPITSVSEVSRVADSNKMPMLIFPISEGASRESSYLIKFLYSLEKQSDTLAKYTAGSLKIKTFAVLYPENSIGKSFKNAFTRSIEAEGAQVVYTGSYSSTPGSLESDIEKIKEARPHAIFIPDQATRSGEIIKEIKKKLPYSDFLYLGPNTWNSAAFLKSGVSGTDKIMFTDFFYPNSKDWMDFSSKFKTVFNIKPGFFEYQVYEAVRLVLNVLKTPVEDRDDIANRLITEGSTSVFNITQTSSGSLQISPKPLVLSVKDGKIIKLDEQ